MSGIIDQALDFLADAGRSVAEAVADAIDVTAEILCPRDHTAEDRLRSWETAAVAVEDEICDEAEAVEFGDYCLIPSMSSAAVSAAADPSPTVPSPSPASVGGEGRKEDSCILPPASFRHPTDPGEVSAPSPEQVLEDDLAAHIMGDFVSGQEVDALTATLIDALSSSIASALLADYRITSK